MTSNIECQRRLEKQTCQPDQNSQLTYDAGFENGWREALLWKCHVHPSLSLFNLLTKIRKIFIRARIGGAIFEDLSTVIETAEGEEMYIEARCPVHNKPLYGNGQTDTHMLFKCPDCDYAGDGPGAVRHDLPERYMALKAENERLYEVIRKQGEECERRHNLLCRMKEVVDEYFS